MDGALARENESSNVGWVGQTLRAIAGVAEGDPQFEPIEDAYRKALAGTAVTIDLAHGERVLALHASPVFDAIGRVNAGIVLAVDVTEERRIEAALNQREQVYRAIVQHLPNSGVMMLDRDLRYVAADGPIMENVIRDAGTQTLLGRTVAELASDANRATMLELYGRVLLGEHRHIEVQRGTRFYDLYAVPIYAGKDVSHALVFLHDVTTRKAELRELEKARATLEQQARELKAASSSSSSSI